MPFDASRIRPLAVALVRRADGAVLAVKCYDKVKREYFYRALGGGIEFGERAEQALRREFREELGVELAKVRNLGGLRIFLPITENQATRLFLLCPPNLRIKTSMRKMPCLLLKKTRVRPMPNGLRFRRKPAFIPSR